MLQSSFLRDMICLLIAALFLVGCFHNNDADDEEMLKDNGTGITGRVTNAKGEPVAGANVKLHLTEDQSITTDSDGRFRFDDVRDGMYQVTVSAAGYRTYLDTITVVGKIARADVVLQPGTPASIAGILTDQTTGVPIANATVQTDPITDSPLTDASGQYRFGNLQPGTYTVRVFANGYEAKSITVVVNRDETARADFQLTPSAVVLSVTPDVLEFGVDATSKILIIENKGKGTLMWNITFPAEGWLTVVPRQGNTTNIASTVNVTVNRQGLAAGNYDLILIITSNAGVKQLPVTMKVQ